VAVACLEEISHIVSAHKDSQDRLVRLDQIHARTLGATTVVVVWSGTISLTVNVLLTSVGNSVIDDLISARM
jgi:hypothetical protein